MAANSRFSLALSIMTHLAYNAGQAMTSGQLAKSLGTNPVVVRRLLGQLRKAGLVTCHPGKAGGCQLARTLGSISLFDIYTAVEGGTPFAIPKLPEHKSCAVSCKMKSILSSALAEAERAIATSLNRVRLSDCVTEVEKSAAKQAT
jgi:Rrf2 family protein